MSSQTFSESWHQVANVRLALLPAVQVHKQLYRGEDWYVLRDPFNNRFFRVRPQAWQFLARLSMERTVEQVWEECLTRHPDDSPGQEEVIRLLAQLHMSNLLHFSGAPDAERMFERARRQRQRELRGKFLSFLFIRIPLWNPERWLRRVEPLIHTIFSKIGLIVWLAVIAVGLKIAAENWGQLGDQAQGVLAPGNLLWLYLAMVVMKTAHEFAHAMMCKRFGGEVHTMGVMLLIFTPLPYMDASSSWAFRNRWHRILVGGAGMIAELFLAALAAVVWVNVGEGTLKALAFNMMLIGSVSSLIFNGNPLLKFDAYYMFSDWLEIPNLQQRANQQWYHWAEKYLFRCRDLYPVAQDTKESAWLATYALLSLLYRALITFGILIFVTDQLLALGLVMLVLTFYMWLWMPLQKLTNYLAYSPRLYLQRKQALVVTIGIAAVLIAFIGLMPVRDAIRAPGVLEATHFARVYAPTPGQLVEITMPSGETVQTGDLLAILRNPELDLDLRAVNAQIQEADAMLVDARSRRIADLKPLQERLQVLKNKREQLLRRRAELHIRATANGIWIAPELNRHLHSWLRLRSEMGLIIDPSQFQFNAVVSQEQAAELFRQQALTGEVRLYGHAGEVLALEEIEVIPGQQRELPSVALGWMGGGKIEVDTQQGEGRLAREAFYKVSAELAGATPLALHGTLGILRCDLPSRPIAAQVVEATQQFLQKRYKL